MTVAIKFQRGTAAPSPGGVARFRASTQAKTQRRRPVDGRRASSKHSDGAEVASKWAGGELNGGNPADGWRFRGFTASRLQLEPWEENVLTQA